MAKSPEQVQVVVDLAGKMSATPPAQLGLILKQFEIEGLEPKKFDPWDIEQIVHDFVDTLSASEIAKLSAYYGLGTSAVHGAPVTEPGTSQAFVFISYDASDKQTAGEISNRLSKLGVHNFLAHRDIKSGKKWRDELIKQLDSTSAMVCIIGREYHQRPVCSQEIGWAIARQIPVVPCSIHAEVEPGKLGLISEIQFIFHKQSHDETAFNILNQLLNETSVGGQVVDALLEKLAASDRYDTARDRWRAIEKAEKLSMPQIIRLATILNDNNQVRDANHGRLEHVVKSKINDWSVKAE